MGRPKVHDAGLRDALLARAGRLVAEKGAPALSLRALAAAEKTSTTAVYSLFGGKPELLAALFEASFSGFGAAQRAVEQTGDTASDLLRLGVAYWDWAQANPHLFAIMFGGALAGFEPDPQQAAAANATIEPLAGAVRKGVDTGVLAGDVEMITLTLWSAVHGATALSLSECGPADREQWRPVLEATTAAAIRGWLAAPLLTT